MPGWLAPLPAFEIDRLEPRWSGGDLLLQICATSPTTVAHAQRRLLADVTGLASVRWVQRGFREPHEDPGLVLVVAALTLRAATRGRICVPEP